MEELPVFAYQNGLTDKGRGLAARGLIEVPNFSATLAWHRECSSRVEHSTLDPLDDGYPGEVRVAWGTPHDETSLAILIAARVVNEIRAGLIQLGIVAEHESWAQLPDEATAVKAVDVLSSIVAIDELTQDPDQQRILFAAIDLVGAFEEIGETWVADEIPVFAERVAEWDPSVRDVTMDEWALTCPEIPTIKGLRDWNEVTEELGSDGYFLNGELLVEECKSILIGVIDVALTVESSRQAPTMDTP